MALDDKLISLFAKTVAAQNGKKDTNAASTLYGKIVEYNGQKYVQLDGSDTLTPAETTIVVKDGDRVIVKIERHIATVTGNLSDPSVGGNTVIDVGNQISEFEIAIGHRLTTEEVIATNAYLESLKGISAKYQEMSSVTAEIETLQADIANIDILTAVDIQVLNAKIDKLQSTFGTFGCLSTDDLIAVDAEIDKLKAYVGEFTYVSADVLEAMQAAIKKLDVEKLSAEQVNLKYANIDFSNITEAAMEYFYANSGLIENVVVSDGTITGMLVGVTIKGDLFEANTVVADKLVILGEDGLYYKLNTNGMTTGAEQTEYNSLNGSIITVKSVTAEKVDVDDLVAFDATIGGFNITENAIFSEVKDSEGNHTRGIYMDTDGQFNFGDIDNFVKYYRDDEGNFHLAISAETILYNINGEQRSIADLGVIGEYVKIGKYEGEPCIELGESDSDFKLIITNTKILFMEGSGVPAYISNQSLFIKKAVIEEELQQGGFVWKARSNGNLGLVWKGVSS